MYNYHAYTKNYTSTFELPSDSDEKKHQLIRLPSVYTYVTYNICMISMIWIPIPPFSEALKAALKLTSEGAGKPGPGCILMGNDGKHFQPPKKKIKEIQVDFGENIGGFDCFDHIFKAFRIGVARPLPGSFEKEKDLVGPSCCNKSHACCLRFMNLLFAIRLSTNIRFFESF